VRGGSAVRRRPTAIVSGMEPEAPFHCFGCEAVLAERTHYCPHCGVRLDSGVTEPRRTAGVEEIVLYGRERPRLLGVPPQDTMLVVGGVSAALSALLLVGRELLAGAALGAVAVLLLLGFLEAVHRRPQSAVVRWLGMALGLIRAQAGYGARAFAAYVRARAGASKLRLHASVLRRSRSKHLLALGDAVYRKDTETTEEERLALQRIDEGVSAKEAERARLERQAKARIRAARDSRDRRAAEARRRRAAGGPVGAR
jgi:hypothetical protein